MMNTPVEPAALSSSIYMPLDPVSFARPMNSNPLVSGIYFKANMVKVWSGRIWKDPAWK